MSTCITCGGSREKNILRHKPFCPHWRETAKAATEADSASDVIRLHPDLAELEVTLDSWYPAA